MKLTEADHMVLSVLVRWPSRPRLLDVCSIAAEAFLTPEAEWVEPPSLADISETQDALAGLMGSDLVARQETRSGVIYSATDRGRSVISRVGQAELGFRPFRPLIEKDSFLL